MASRNSIFGGSIASNDFTRAAKQLAFFVLLPVLAPLMMIAGVCWFCIWLNNAQKMGAQSHSLRRIYLFK